ncbi:hypothetical protein IJ541_06720 [bacterium]|nr:hypothetical protein [bacterium]
MRKILFLVIIIISFCLPSNAYEVKYNNAGAIVSTTQPQFGTNAIYTPQNVAINAERSRQIRYANQYYDSLANSKNINLNINHNGLNRVYYPNYNPRYIYNYGYPTRTPFINNGRLYNTNGININNRGFYIY